MKRLDNLNEIANRQMAGLEASATLLARIRLEAAERKRPNPMRVMRPVLAVCAALVLCVGAVNVLKTPEETVADTPMLARSMMDSQAAGSAAVTAEPRTLGDVPQGSISMSAANRKTAGSLFAPVTGSSFPLVSVEGATYRLLTSPAAVSASLTGEAVATVSEFNIEPALASGGVVSNAVSMGETVYAIDGMGGALVAAQVDGALRVFQRVSYAGTAIIGSETLGDTLCAPALVEWIELDGLGRVEGAKAQELMRVLLSDADYQSTACSGEGSMQIGLVNGISLQLLVGEDAVSACGTWSCPGFFEAFAEAVGV